MGYARAEMAPWKRIGLALKPGQAEMPVLLERVLRIIRDRGFEVELDGEAAALLGAPRGLERSEIAERVDLFVVLGGDGTVLATARAIGARPVPILGVNLGRLGFLTETSPEEAVATLERVFDGDYSEEERGRLEVVTWEGERELEGGLALNDAVFSKAPHVARLIEIETKVDGHKVGTYRADGLVVSTPTGSTAYNLSAGGPILDPKVDAMILTPICPHTLSLRPLVLDAESEVEVRLPAGDEANLTLDGQVGRALQPSHFVRITRSAYPARFLTLPGRDHFGTVRRKLGWGST